jgi:hypothetical protein
VKRKTDFFHHQLSKPIFVYPIWCRKRDFNYFYFNLATGRLLYKYVVKREKVLNIGYASALFQRGI